MRGDLVIRGKDNIYYGWHTGIFGDYLIAVSDRQVVGLAFKLDKGHRNEATFALRRPFRKFLQHCSIH